MARLWLVMMMVLVGRREGFARGLEVAGSVPAIKAQLILETTDSVGAAWVERALVEVDSVCRALPVKTTDRRRLEELDDEESLDDVFEILHGTLTAVMSVGSESRRRILALVGDGRGDWRTRAVWTWEIAMGEVREPEAVPILARILRNRSEPIYLRHAAARGLVDIAGYDGGRVVTEVLRDTSEPPALRAKLVTQLSAVGSDDVDLLMQEVRGPWQATAPRYDWVPLRAIDALGKSRNPRATALLLDVGKGMSDQGWALPLVIRALGWRKAREAVPWLMEVLEKSPNDLNRKFAAEALGAIGDHRAIPALMKALDDREALVISEAAEALRLLRARTAVPVLKHLLENADTDPRIRWDIDPATGRKYEHDLTLPTLRKAYAELSR